MEIVLYQPEIAGNVGACIRLSANTGLPLNIIKPLGFNFQENKIRRAGLDYHDLATVSMYENWSKFEEDITIEEIVERKEVVKKPKPIHVVQQKKAV